HVALPDKRAPPATASAADAPRAGQPRRRARGRGSRFAAGGDHGTSGGGRGRAHGGAVRAARGCERALARARAHTRGGAERDLDRRRAARVSEPIAVMEPALVRAPLEHADVLLCDVHALDPRAKLDGPADVRVRAGRIAEIGAPGALPADPETEVVEAAGQHLLPAFVDPHVHLRTPGQEHKEDISSGTR